MIALARSYPEGPVPLAEIAKAEGLSRSYLEQLIACLRKAGLVESTRGMRGGYRLTDSPGAMTAGQVVRALEGPIALAECASEVDTGCCARESDCASKHFWQQVRDNIAQVMDGTTLADLAGGSAVAQS
jgi:Rrf2 family cysteine metabolism transcriptional repressor